MFSSQNSQVSNGANYIEDVFSTWLYAGNGSTQTITNGIDLSTKGGLVWQKDRSQGTGYHHILQDTARGATNVLFTNLTNAQSQDSSGTGFVFNNNGFTIGTSNVKVNASGDNYVSWTFRKQPKFFDVVTYTGTGVNTTVSHNLNATVGFMLIKCTSQSGRWIVYHRSISPAQYLLLNTTDAATAGSGVDTPAKYWNSTAPTSTVFSLGDSAYTNESGQTYVAYLFAHDAGGFGLTGTDNVISCGSFTTDGSGLASVTLGYEPQYLMLKASTAAEPWNVTDTMRGWTQSGTNDIRYLQPNTSGAEGSASNNWEPNATGFSVIGGLSSSTTYIYIAIRRGPMKVPTSGTSVFSPTTYTGNATTNNVPAGFPTDMFISAARSGASQYSHSLFDRLRGKDRSLRITMEAANELSGRLGVNIDNNTGVLFTAADDEYNRNGAASILWQFRRSPNFFDAVCYTGNGTAGATQTHNLKAVPEMMIVKDRNYTGGRPWVVYHSALGATKFTYMDQTTTPTTSSAAWNDTTPTSSVFTLGSNSIVNFSGTNYVAYLFATCAGVSKVGSYTGTGALQTINCGFTSGARFVYIHRTDSAGDWWVYDSARGIASGNDPYLLMNSAAAETTGTNYVDTDSTGFKVTAAAPADLNASGGTYIFLAIA